MTRTKFPSSLRQNSRSSSALVLTLMAVVIVTLAVLIFFTSVSANRQIENSRVHGAESDQMIRTANEYVVAQFIQEITNSANSVYHTDPSGVTVYSPRYGTNAIPQCYVSSNVGNNTNFFNLIRQSIPSADSQASGDSAGVAAQNGTVVGLVQWNAPMLLTSGGFTDNTQLPNWIYVDRSSGPTSSPTKNTIGRFAYNVYNIGGLLNANAAGYSSAAATEIAADPTKAYLAKLNGTLAGADLTQLGVSSTAVNNLVTFREPTTSGNGDNYLSNAVSAATEGFLSPIVTNSASASTVYTDNYFFNRQDLLRYALTQNQPFTNAVPYLTTFSRSVTAPSWGPLADVGSYTYLSSDDASTSTNRFLPNVRVSSATTLTHYNDDGTTQTYSVQAGDPLIQRRFSLAKLAWLGHSGPNSAAFNSTLNATQIAAAIQGCFGLQWNSSNTTSQGSPDPRWDYVGSQTTMQSSIDRLDQVASEAREPNFFELLQAGILSGSLGQTGDNAPNPTIAVQDARTGASIGDTASYGSVMADEVNTNYQVIRIGANIIDQSRADNYPTAIGFDAFEFWGIKDLPYFNRLLTYTYWPNPKATINASVPPTPPVYFYWVYELWNPHQPTGIQGPTHFRVRINDDARYEIAYWDSTFGHWTLPPDTSSFQSAACQNSPLIFTANNMSSSVTQNFRDPQVIETGTRTVTMGGADALLITDSSNSPESQHNNNCSFFQSNTVYILEYSEDGTNYRPYATFEGHEEAGGVIGLGGPIMSDGPGMTTFQADPANTSTLGYLFGYSKTDPRTFRFDCQWIQFTPMNTSFRPNATTYYPAFYFKPWFMGADGTAGNMAELASNNPNNTAHFYGDPDGAIRLGDGFYNDQNPYQAGDTTGGASSQRPIILDRPFRSVAEMGYAYRDLPFKTLDFFTSASGDKGLLDFFSIIDEPTVTAGTVDLNTAQPPVRQSLLSGNVDGINATTLGSDYQSYIFNSGPTPTANFPVTRAQLADFLYGNSSVGTSPGSTPTSPSTFSSVNLKTSREAAIRSLGGPVQTRTWNLLIDVVAQTGRFAGSSTSGNAFTVEGKKHCWLSIAIDRYTGKVVDKQVEFVNE